MAWSLPAPGAARKIGLTMKRAAAIVFTLLSAPAIAALEVGADAPDFTIPAALAGEAFEFSLADALKRGPVVLYFFPAAFTAGCTIEAHLFAEATERFKALGATVIGVSHDDIETMKRFSATECRNRFAVGADSARRVSEAYDAVMRARPAYASRTSYLITPDGKIAYEYTESAPERHVANTLAALEAWRAQRK